MYHKKHGTTREGKFRLNCRKEIGELIERIRSDNPGLDDTEVKKLLYSNHQPQGVSESRLATWQAEARGHLPDADRQRERSDDGESSNRTMRPGFWGRNRL